jgi:hypothetical protein
VCSLHVLRDSFKYGFGINQIPITVIKSHDHLTMAKFGNMKRRITHSVTSLSKSIIPSGVFEKKGLIAPCRSPGSHAFLGLTW